MAADQTQYVVPQMARLWLAAVGVAAPAGPTVIFPVGWRDVGLFTPDSLSFATDANFEQVRSHQLNYPGREFQTEESGTVSVDLQQWNGANFIAVYGGGTITSVTPTGVGAVPYFRFAPPGVGGRQSVQCCLEIIDGAKHYRRVVPRVFQGSGVEQGFNKTSESLLPLRLTILGSDLTDPFYDLTDDPNFDPALLAA